MPPTLRVIIGFVLIAMGIMGLVTGRIMAGSKGLNPIYHYRSDNPLAHFFFVGIYLAIGAVLVLVSV